MAMKRGLFVPLNGAAGTTPIEARLAFGGLLVENAPGVPRSGVMENSKTNLVYGSGASLSAVVDPSHYAIHRTQGEGVYSFANEGATTVPLTAAPVANSRIDLIWVKQNDIAKGDADNLAVVGVEVGTAAATPSAPYGTVPAGAMVLAEALVSVGNTLGTQVTFTQVFEYTAARGSTIRVRDLADRNTITSPYLGQQVIRMDRNNHVQRWNGTAWKWVSDPERYYADPATFSTTSNTADKVIGIVSAAPTRTYATVVRVNGRLTVSSAAIGSGSLQLRTCVSAGVELVDEAQAKSFVSFGPPGSYWLTGNMETDWIAIGAGVSPRARIWTQVFSGAVAHAASNDRKHNHLWCEVLPADD
ncbi:minor tail protein [Arthrobacter phage Beethoven]|uniref:Minor tail protein n=3 Tax=Korravirus TaxID=1982076 RepID=A0A3S9UHF2_9CAUD|nr:virion structural protein [Arthrobacter phage Wawa]AZF98486.1 minor tail protein [Arthrobacter phage Beethoven]AZS09775.1 minor tail protein [Arthrobacter phage Rozby]AZS11129.1 minor tail protein [Arthrobacter phage Wawa]